MKRALLIAGGTVGSLGAVFAITPPTFTSTQSSLAIGGNQAAPAAPTPTESATPAPTESVTTGATKKPSASSTKTSTTAPAATQSAEPTATQSAAVTSGKAQSGTFIGEPSTMRYGTVQVKITISGGKIIDAVAVQAPGGRDQRYTDMAVPVMRQKVLAAQSSNVTAVSGASYTSYAYWVSLQSALTKAGWL
ncbi:MAG: hypothetical protein RJA33_48 [Actinomycetota bacterium]|jgi:uncharacterized protein with FMN-binding domain